MKLTKEQLQIYAKYAGDEDGLARLGDDEEKRKAAGKPWATISGLIQSWRLIKAGRTSGSFSDEFEISLRAHLENSAVEDFKTRF